MNLHELEAFDVKTLVALLTMIQTAAVAGVRIAIWAWRKFAERLGQTTPLRRVIRQEVERGVRPLVARVDGLETRVGVIEEKLPRKRTHQA